MLTLLIVPNPDPDLDSALYPPPHQNPNRHTPIPSPRRPSSNYMYIIIVAAAQQSLLTALTSAYNTSDS